MAIPVITRIREWRTKRRLKRLENDLNMLRNRLTFNPIYAYNYKKPSLEERYTKRLTEYNAWYSGSSREIRELYQKAVRQESLNYFWFRCPSDWRMLHSGIPSLISRKMANIIFGSGYNLETVVYKEDGEIDQEASDNLKEHAEYIAQKVKLKDIQDEGAQSESWGGHLFVKLSHDTTLSEYPIVEVATPMNAEVVKVRGITTEIIFKTWYEHKNKNYRLDEIYTTNDAGDAMIAYELYEMASSGERRVDLYAIPNTAYLREILGEETHIVFEGLKGMLAFEKANISPSHEFAEGPYGASDYEGALDSFDALDEAYTELINEIRNNKTLRMIPDTMVPIATVPTVNGGTGKAISEGRAFIDNKYITNFLITTGDLDQEANNRPEYIYVSDKTEDHKKKYLAALTTAINNAGLSPFALGITGLESVSASAESQQERNKVTIETRNKKCSLWKELLEEVYLQLLVYNSWLVKNLNIKQEGFVKQDIKFENCDVRITFNDYLSSSQKQLNDIWLPVMSARAMSHEKFVKQTNPNMTKEQVLEEVNKIRFEQGMSIDNPMALPDLNFLGKDKTGEEEK